jgi:hypothetical protein
MHPASLIECRSTQGDRMSTTHADTLIPQEQEQFSAMVERMRQLRRRAGIPDGMTVQQALTLHIISAAELERARWGAGGDTLD